MNSPPDFSKEDLKGSPTEFAPGAWVLGHRHYAGGMLGSSFSTCYFELGRESRIFSVRDHSQDFLHSNFPFLSGISTNIVLNNRCFVFKLKLREALGGVSAGKDALFVFGLGNDGAIEGVKRLENQTGLKAVALLCNGGGHHIYIKNWYDAFPAPFQVWVCPTKVPGTSNGQRLQKDYPDRWMLVDNSTTDHHVHQLLKYFGSGDNLQVDCILFNQLYGYSDKTSGESGCHQSPEAKVGDNGFKHVFKALTALGGDVSTPTDDTIFYHMPSGLIITGHHWEFCYYPKGYEVSCGC